MSESDCLTEIEEEANEAISILIPQKSKLRYEAAFAKYEDWCKTTGIVNMTDKKVLLEYFTELSRQYKPSSLWSFYSMVRSMMYLKTNVDISTNTNLLAFIKKKSVGYKPKKSKVLTKNDIAKFLLEASDDKYLFMKVALIIGVAGAFRKQELTNLTVGNLQFENGHVQIYMPCTKINMSRRFVVATGDITGINLFELIKKYFSLRPKCVDHDRFFLNYRNKRCTKQAVGINTFGSLPKQIAILLKLQDPELYTGHCFKRSSTSLLADLGAEILTTTQNRFWKSNNVREECILNSLEKRTKIAMKLLGEQSTETNLYTQESSSSYGSLPENHDVKEILVPQTTESDRIALGRSKMIRPTSNSFSTSAVGLPFGTDLAQPTAVSESNSSEELEYFCLEDSLLSKDLNITIGNTGVLKFPIQLSDIKEITKVLTTSNVKVEIDPQSLEDILTKTKRALTKEAENFTAPVLNNVFISEPGQFFNIPLNAVSSFDAIATLIVILPSFHVGGEMIIKNNSRKHMFFGSKNQQIVKCAVFSKSCTQEIKLVTEGCLMALTFALVRQPLIKSGIQVNRPPNPQQKSRSNITENVREMELTAESNGLSVVRETFCFESSQEIKDDHKYKTSKLYLTEKESEFLSRLKSDERFIINYSKNYSADHQEGNIFEESNICVEGESVFIKSEPAEHFKEEFEDSTYMSLT